MGRPVGGQRGPKSADKVMAHRPTSRSIHEPVLSVWQLWLHDVLASSVLRALLAVVILANLVCTVVQTDREAAGEEPLFGIAVFDSVTLGTFTFEFACKVFVFRSRTLRDAWNIFDVSVLFVEYMMLVLESFVADFPMGSVRVLRLFRLARSARVLNMFPELSLMVMGMFEAIKIVVCGILMLSVFLTVVGVLSVNLLHPVNQRVASKGIYEGCERCPRAFESTFSSVLTFTQQIVTGDSWGVISIPVIEEQPATMLFIGIVFTCIAMILLNIILSMVVETSLKVAAEDSKRLLREMDVEYAKQTKCVADICAALDTDKSGLLDKDEFFSGFERYSEFQDMMRIIDVDVDDLEEVFAALDTGGTGEIDYSEFIIQMRKMRTHNTRTTEFITKRSVLDMRARMSKLEQSLLPCHGKAASGGHAADACPSASLVETADALDLRQRFASDVSRLLQDLQNMADSHTEMLRSLMAPPADDVEPRARAPLPSSVPSSCRRRMAQDSVDQEVGACAHAQPLAASGVSTPDVLVRFDPSLQSATNAVAAHI
mmetsp:Transcript_101813/g.285361  ORF Transcript_101813/g.285361 Transcript_101813/m.285361 type:complete len:544 (-) Transcript_101813:68-1699(-)